jgi:hypothetical protein
MIGSPPFYSTPFSPPIQDWLSLNNQTPTGPADDPTLKLARNSYILKTEDLAKITYPVIPAKAGIQNSFKILDSGSRSACPE